MATEQMNNNVGEFGADEHGGDASDVGGGGGLAGQGGGSLQDANSAAARKGELFDSSLTFKDLGIRNSVLKGLESMGFKHPTKIQALLIPHLMSGKDMLGQARTGTGKTGAFGLPLLHKGEGGIEYQALIMVPTRELCVQVAQELQAMGEFTPMRTVAIYGGERMGKQIDALVKGPEIVVSTPGRLMDMIERGHLHLNNVRYAVLDEVDRMLDIGFREDIRRILAKCPKEGRQTVFVSATISPEIERLAKSFAKDAEKVIATVQGSALTTSTVKQFHLPVTPWDKKRLLHHLLMHEEPDTTLVFCKMKRTVDGLEKYLQDKGIEAHAIHGDKAQNKRNRVIEQLKSGKLAVLIASDLVSRGIDVEGISHVINYDLPEDPEVYVHRIGRTARIGREGVAWALVTPEDGPLLTAIEMLINAEIPKMDYPDFVPSTKPERFHDRDARPGSRRDEPGLTQLGPDGKPVEHVAPIDAGTGAPRAATNTQASRIESTIAPPVPVAGSGASMDAQKFPGGIVPTKMPPRRMFGRIKGR